MNSARRSARMLRRHRVAGSLAVAVVAGVGVLGGEAALALSGGGSAQPPGSPDGVVGGGGGAPVRLVVLGDSTGAAVGADRLEDGYPRRLAARLAAATGRPIDLRVLAVSGAEVGDVRRKQLPQLADLHPDVVLIVVGANDVVNLSTPWGARGDLRAVLAGVHRLSRHVVVSGIPAMGTVPRTAQPLRALLGSLGRGFDVIWRDECRAAHVVRVDLAAATGPAFERDRSLFSGDGFHPSSAGYELWAEAFLPSVLAEVRRLPPT